MRSGDPFIITGEGNVQMRLRQLWREKADEGRNDKGCHNRNGAGGGRRGKGYEQVEHIEAHAGNKAGPDTGGRRATPEKPVDERPQKRAGQRAPGERHQRGDEVVGIEREYNGKRDEKDTQRPDPAKLFVGILQAP